MVLQKAYIKVLEECNIDKIKFSKDEKIEVQFNPEKYSVNSAISYASNLKDGNIYSQYSGRGASQLSFELFYDMLSKKEIAGNKQEDKDVNGLLDALLDEESVNKSYVNKILALTRPSEEKSRPPLVEFEWGGEVFRGVISSISREYSMFNSKGEPIRANIRVTITECEELGANTKQLTLSAIDVKKKKKDDQKEAISEKSINETHINAMRT